MTSFRKEQPPRSRYCYASDDGYSGEPEVSDIILDIFVHHARNINNICIYDKQDVYAKFSLTYNPDDTISTRIVNKGGKNPDFNQSVAIKLHHTTKDAVLKCEIWMLSRARNLLEDQLLGFTLVPISMVASKEQLITEEFSLSSTDLFHSPAGTIKLSLSLKAPTSSSTSKPYSHVPGSSSITSEVVFLDRKIAETIEFPDINVVYQTQQMVSEYFCSGSRPSLIGEGSFLHLGAPLDDDSEMTLNSSEENLSYSTTTNLSDDNRNTADSNNSPKYQTTQGEEQSEQVKNTETEQSAMQKQIVDMYTKSMNQFTESLAKMKLPMDVDKPESEGPKNAVPIAINPDRKKDGSRVFYGSRAFF